MSDIENPNEELIAGLCDLAAWLRDHPVKGICYQMIHIFPNDEAELREVAKIMGGLKEPLGDKWFTLVKDFGTRLQLRACLEREKVCERVQVGQTVVPAEPEHVVPAKPEIVVPVYEWRCPKSLLAAGGAP